MKPNKRNDVAEMLREDWVAVDVLCQSTGWQPHTLRAVLSGLKKNGMQIERQRLNGVTSYRAADKIEAAAS